MGTRHCQF